MSKSAKSDNFILPGLKPVLEILGADAESIEQIIIHDKDAGPNLKKIIALASQRQVPVKAVGPAALTELCGAGVSHQGAAALLKRVPLLKPEEILQRLAAAPLPLLIALDQIHDPGNLGTLARTAWALGCGGFILPEHGCVAPNPSAMRSSAGALVQLPVAIADNLARTLDFLEEEGLTIYGTCAEHEALSGNGLVENAFTHRWRLPAVLVLGNENKGVRPGVAKRCGIFLSIPFARSFDSLNVAQAGAILIGLCAAQFSSQ